MEIEQVAVSQLIPYAKNSRTHTDQQVAEIAASIREFGFCNPILIAPDNSIIAGHGRAKAAHLLKLETAPCIRLGHLSFSQRRAYVIADNRIAMNAGWDAELLRLELTDLKKDDFNLDLLGFGSGLEMALSDPSEGDPWGSEDGENSENGNSEGKTERILLIYEPDEYAIVVAMAEMAMENLGTSDMSLLFKKLLEVQVGSSKR